VLKSNTDQAWESFGKFDPYFGVISDPRFQSKNLNKEAREEFFRSGNVYTSQLVATIRQRVTADFRPKRSLDFGCGVGRILIPLARLSVEVVGVDVSKSMLAEALVNTTENGVNNVTLVESDDSLSRLNGSFDFIHSFIVFQHINPSRGEQVLNHLLKLLSPGGVASLHFTYGATQIPQKVISFMQRRVPLARNVFNLLKRRSWAYPTMEMNSYSIPRLIDIFAKHGISTFYAETTNHGGYVGLQFFLHKTR